jgi:hypothetical protein
MQHNIHTRVNTCGKHDWGRVMGRALCVVSYVRCSGVIAPPAGVMMLGRRTCTVRKYRTEWPCHWMVEVLLVLLALQVAVFLGVRPWRNGCEVGGQGGGVGGRAGPGAVGYMLCCRY